MGFLTSRKSRSTKRAEARALKAKAKLEARLAARNDRRRMRVQARSESAARRDARKTELATLKAQRQIAQDQLRAVREGKLLSPTRIKRTLTVVRLLAPVLLPLLYKAAIAVRGVLDQRRADRLGIPLAELGQYSGFGAELSARIAGAEQSLQVAGPCAQGCRDQEVHCHRSCPARGIGYRGGGIRTHAADPAARGTCRHRPRAGRH